MQVLINGVDRTSAIDLRTLVIDDAIGERSTARFNVTDLSDGLGDVLISGASVLIVHGDDKFGGTIERPRQRKPKGGSVERDYAIECVDWHQVCDRRVVAEAYAQVPAGDIVRDLVDKYLATEGVTYAVDSVQDGPIVVECVFNYVSATTCLDTLSERAGYEWWIDADKVLHFVERATYQAPWALDDPDLVNDLEVEQDRQGYRNRQYIKAGKDVTDPQTEHFKGDGATRTWTVGFPIAKVPTITLNGVSRSVGIKGIDSGCDCYWNKGDAVLTQDEAGTILADTDDLAVTYQGFFDVVVLTTDEAAIEERKSVEGGSGWYEAVEEEPYLSSREAAIQSGNAKLRKNARIPRTITFNTWHPGLRAGQLLTVNLPDRKLSGDFLIDRVTLSRLCNRAGQEYWSYAVRAVSGESLGGWARFFRNMATRGQAFVIRENIREDQVLIYLMQASETWDWAETVAVQVFACPIPSPNLYPSSSLYPC